MEALLSLLVRSVTVLRRARPITTWDGRHILVDGELRKDWYPGEDPNGDWRHMVYVDTEKKVMYEHSGRSGVILLECLKIEIRVLTRSCREACIFHTWVS